MAAAKKPRPLTARDLKTVRSLPPIAGQSPTAVENVRLAMLARGGKESPANPTAVIAAIELPLEEHLRFIAPVEELAASMPTVTYTDDGGATVGEYTMRPLKGSDAYLRGKPEGRFSVIADLIGCDVETMLEMPLGEYAALDTAFDFLVMACRLASTSSARPSQSPESA